jgi:hypothetical protein
MDKAASEAHGHPSMEILDRQVDHINNEKRLMAQISYPFIVNMMGYSKAPAGCDFFHSHTRHSQRLVDVVFVLRDGRTCG